MGIVKINNDYFEEVQEGPEGWGDVKIWKGLRPIKCSDATEKLHRFLGKKITMAQVREILSFFEWSYSETKSETLIHAFYHDDHGWAFIAMPQKGWNGMTISSLPDHENWAPSIRRLPGTWDGTPETWTEACNKSWVPMGTWHHHCSSPAFQSGTDRHDESSISKEGLHITIGNVGSNQYSVDLRASYSGHFTPVKPSDWFELDAALSAQIPASAVDDVIIYQLRKPPTEPAFPEWWKENVIRVQASVQTYNPTGNSAYQPPYYGGVSNVPAHWRPEDYKRNTERGSRRRRKERTYGSATLTQHEEHQLVVDIRQFAEWQNVPMNMIAGLLHSFVNDDPIPEMIIDLLRKHDVGLSKALSILEDRLGIKGDEILIIDDTDLEYQNNQAVQVSVVGTDERNDRGLDYLDREIAKLEDRHENRKNDTPSPKVHDPASFEPDEYDGMFGSSYWHD